MNACAVPIDLCTDKLTTEAGRLIRWKRWPSTADSSSWRISKTTNSW